MDEGELVEQITRSRSAEAATEFARRVNEQAEAVSNAIVRGDFDNECYSIGLELEAYAFGEDGSLARIPDEFFDRAPCTKELGLHNVEVNTEPDRLDEAGLERQSASIEQAVRETNIALGDRDCSLAMDAMWTIPPPEGTVAYLGDVEVVDGVTIATNMRDSPRYAAIDTELVDKRDGSIDIDLPGVAVSFPTILPEALTTSIQPHLQIPDTDAFPQHYRVGIRTLGPVLALATNSPFLPADLYGTGPNDPYAIVDATPHECRIPVFEQSINVEEPGKVRFPGDLEETADVVDRLLADRTCAPFLREWVAESDVLGSFADEIWELEHKRGTYWRWLRAVIGGDPLDGVREESLRIEYRPLPTQPSVPDVVGLQALVAGLIRGLVIADHPIVELDWQAAERCFYDAVDEGLAADLAWVAEDGTETADPAVVFDEIFEYARQGLAAHDVSADQIETVLEPIERRWTERATPSRWKKGVVRDRLDAGDGLPAAIEGMQRAYLEQCSVDRAFVDW